MPFALIVIGLIGIVSAVKGTQGQLGNQLVDDFTGGGNFIYWILAIFFVGLLGYIPVLSKFSKVGLVLVCLSLILAHGGFFENFMTAIQQGPTAPAGNVSTSAQVQSTTNTASGSGIGSLFTNSLNAVIPGAGSLLGGIGSLF